MLKKIIYVFLMMTSVSVYAQNFVQRQGNQLFFQGNEIHLRGMAFGNLVFDDNENPVNHHSEIDLERVRALGMNAIRFYMNYKTFEDDANPYTYKQSGWDWIDENIQWAKANKIFLILNLHVPQGGYQSRCAGTALWTDAENQKRVAALWKAIAARYKDEPVIAGYDILNEPTPSGSIQNWSNLAQRIIDSIRAADPNHLIITERALALDCDYAYNDANTNYPQITETNLMYTVHLYDPFEYTHQNLSWAGTGDGGKYPDDNRITVPADASYATGNYANPSVAAGTNDWTHVTGVPFTVNADSIICGRVVFLSGKIGAGTVYFDDFELQELDAAGNVLRTIYTVNPTSGTYWWWSQNGTGNYSASTTGHTDSYSVAVSGNTASATVICPDYSFRVYKGKKYVISGWIKGENIPAGASASISTEFYYSPSKATLAVRNYEFLKDKIIGYTKYIEDKGFPVYFGEFGAARTCFVDGKGGAQWVADAIHVFDSLGYNFTYHAYKESSFGYYDGWDQPVDESTVNTDLKAVFTEYFTNNPLSVKAAVANERSVILFPNPAYDNIHIVFNDGETIDALQIMDIRGNVVLTSTQSTISIRSLPAGMYLVKVNKGSLFGYSKIIVQ